MSVNRQLANTLAGMTQARTLTHERGVVQTVNAGPPATVTLTMNGGTGTLTCRYAKGYTPVVGDTAEVIRTDGMRFAVFLA